MLNSIITIFLLYKLHWKNYILKFCIIVIFSLSWFYLLPVQYYTDITFISVYQVYVVKGLIISMIGIISLYNNITPKKLIFFCCIPFFTALIPLFKPWIYSFIVLIFSIDNPYTLKLDYVNNNSQPEDILSKGGKDLSPSYEPPLYCLYGSDGEPNENARPTYRGDTREPQPLVDQGWFDLFHGALNEDYNNYRKEIEIRRLEAGVRGNYRPGVTLHLMDREIREVERKLRLTNRQAPINISDLSIIKSVGAEVDFRTEITVYARGLTNGRPLDLRNNTINPRCIEVDVRRLAIARELEEARNGRGGFYQ